MSAYLGEATRVYSNGQRAQRVTFVYLRTRAGKIAFVTSGAKGLGDLTADANRLFEERT